MLKNMKKKYILFENLTYCFSYDLRIKNIKRIRKVHKFLESDTTQLFFSKKWSKDNFLKKTQSQCNGKNDSKIIPQKNPAATFWRKNLSCFRSFLALYDIYPALIPNKVPIPFFLPFFSRIIFSISPSRALHFDIFSGQVIGAHFSGYKCVLRELVCTFVCI